MSAPECPRCHDRVSLPLNAPPEATVQCPLCQEEFELSEVLDAMPPALVVTRMPKGTATTAAAASSSAGFDFADTDEGEEFQFASSGDDAAATAESHFAFDSGSSEVGAAEGVSRGAVTARPRPKKKQVNPVKEIVKVAFGGIAGVLIAIVLLWYLPGRYGQDILGIGPSVAEIPVLGGVVPEKFRGGSTSPNNDAAIGGDDTPRLNPGGDGTRGPGIESFGPLNNNRNNNQQENNRGATNTPAGSAEPEELVDGSPFDTPENSTGADPFALDADPLAIPELDPVGIDPLAELDPAMEEPVLDDPTAGEPPSGNAPAAESSEVANPAVNEVATSEPPAETLAGPRAPGGELLGPKQRPQVSAADLSDSIQAVRESEKAYAGSFDAPAAEQRAVAEKLYNDYAELAADITFLDPTDPSLTSDIRAAAQLLEDLGKVPKSVTIMQYFASEDLRKPENAEKGVLLIGKVTAMAAGEDLFLSKIDIDSSGTTPREYTVVLPNNPTETAPEFQPGSRVALLGTIVINPEENLRGYQGNQPVVVWGGYFVMLESDA